jgi:predicted metal-dependent HD superfamily phosphohydrolase
MANLSSIPWPDVVAVGIRTTADGPFAEDVFWQFLLRDGVVEIPGACVDGSAFDELRAHLPGLDSAKVIRAMTSTQERIFRVWHHVESRFWPSREDLAVRFRALVGKVGGDPDASSPAFDSLYAAWSADSRHYHDVEHLVDCLRELDAANARIPTADIAELALWYHDVVYEPGASDCEERSARVLLADAEKLGIPEASTKTAADLVRATAHAQGGALRTPAADLVHDIDLSILGRDVLRFMDFEYGVEEEYAATSTISFRRGRGRFLAGLLERPHIFRTEHFRGRYEARARDQIGALLASPRYRSYR